MDRTGRVAFLECWFVTGSECRLRLEMGVVVLD